MGGGPCHWAVEDHLRAGLAVYATPEAAKTFNDDLDWVQREMGVRLVGDEEAARLSGRQIRMGDLDLNAIHAALAAFGVEPDYDGLAVAAFDHGNAPPRDQRPCLSLQLPGRALPGRARAAGVASAARMCRPR